MQAVILAAGLGKRLRDLTKNNTKCMVEVNGVSLIDRVLTQLSRQNLSRVVIVVGYQADTLIRHIGHRYDDVLKIEYIHNPIYDKTNNIYSLALAKDKLLEDDTLLIESDLILDDSIFPLILENPYPNLALVAKYQTWMDGTMVRIDEDYNIVNFIPKKAFKYTDVNFYYKTVNVYKFSKDFMEHKYLPFLNAYCSALGNNEYYEQVLRVICMLDNSELKALPIGERKWYEIDDIQDLDIATALFSDQNDRLKLYMKRYGGYWRFPQMLDYCYLVNPYFPSPRMKDELRANFDILLGQYPSGLEVNSLLASKFCAIKQAWILPGNGAAELIKALMERLQGKLGLVSPTFEEYPNRREREDLEIFYPQSEDFHYSLEELIAHFEAHPVESLLLINPDNPSGNYFTSSEVHKLLEWTRQKGIRLIVDESFADFSEEFPENSLLKDSILEEYPNLVVVKSISKSFGVPGLRLGILASQDTALIKELRSDLSIWNINSFAEFFMQIYNKYEGDYRKSASHFFEERRRFHKDLSRIPYLQVFDSQANFFLCKVLPPYSSKELATVLLQNYNILIKDCSTKKAFEGKNYIRLAIRNREDNLRLIAALEDLAR